MGKRAGRTGVKRGRSELERRKRSRREELGRLEVKRERGELGRSDREGERTVNRERGKRGREGGAEVFPESRDTPLLHAAQSALPLYITRTLSLLRRLSRVGIPVALRAGFASLCILCVCCHHHLLTLTRVSLYHYLLKH